VAQLPPPPRSRGIARPTPSSPEPAEPSPVRDWGDAAGQLDAPQLEPEPAKASPRPVQEARANLVPLELAHPDVSARTAEAETALEPAPAHALAPRPSASPSPSPAPTLDPVTLGLAALAIGLLLAIVPARFMAERFGERSVAPLLDELAESIERPLDVESGELREPALVRTEIEGFRGRARTRYFAYWAIGALPLAAIAFVLTRRRA
jgi:hypothetical protein